jgi:hypothetical protein
MRPTTGASLAPSVAQRAREATSPALVVYRCEAFAAWITEATCGALKARGRIKSPVVEAL